MWIRTCQECGHIQPARKPTEQSELTDAYRNTKCKRCKSEALDYGKENDQDGKASDDPTIRVEAVEDKTC